MTEPSDVWYVRLPDGRVLRAGSTAAVRHHLESGEIPAESRVRRSPGQAWGALERTAEFADLAPNRNRRPAARPAPVVPQHNNLQLQAVGVRGLVDELQAALDSTLVQGKLRAAALLGFALGVLLIVAGRFAPGAELSPLLPWSVAGLLMLGIHGLCTVHIAQATFVELSRLRPATRAEIQAGLWGKALRLIVAELLAGGVLLLAIVGLRWLEGWLAAQACGELACGAAAAVRLVLEVVLWPVLGLALLLGPVLVVEECGVGAAVRQWGTLLRRHLGRLFVYEALAAALALVMSLPLLFPVALAAWSCSPAEMLNPIVAVTLAILGGLALTPLLAYLVVANVYIYLSLRYEYTPSSH